MPSLVSLSPGGNTAPTPASVRLSWPEAFIIMLAVILTIYLNMRDTPILAAVGIAAGVMAVFVAVIAIPRCIGQIAKNLQLLRRAADELARLHDEQERPR